MASCSDDRFWIFGGFVLTTVLHAGSNAALRRYTRDKLRFRIKEHHYTDLAMKLARFGFFCCFGVPMFLWMVSGLARDGFYEGFEMTQCLWGNVAMFTVTFDLYELGHLRGYKGQPVRIAHHVLELFIALLWYASDPSPMLVFAGGYVVTANFAFLLPVLMRLLPHTKRMQERSVVASIVTIMATMLATDAGILWFVATNWADIAIARRVGAILFAVGFTCLDAALCRHHFFPMVHKARLGTLYSPPSTRDLFKEGDTRTSRSSTFVVQGERAPDVELAKVERDFDESYYDLPTETGGYSARSRPSDNAATESMRMDQTWSPKYTRGLSTVSRMSISRFSENSAYDLEQQHGGGDLTSPSQRSQQRSTRSTRSTPFDFDTTMTTTEKSPRNAAGPPRSPSPGAADVTTRTRMRSIQASRAQNTQLAYTRQKSMPSLGNVRQKSVSNFAHEMKTTYTKPVKRTTPRSGSNAPSEMKTVPKHIRQQSTPVLGMQDMQQRQKRGSILMNYGQSLAIGSDTTNSLAQIESDDAGRSSGGDSVPHILSDDTGPSRDLPPPPSHRRSRPSLSLDLERESPSYSRSSISTPRAVSFMQRSPLSLDAAPAHSHARAQLAPAAPYGGEPQPQTQTQPQPQPSRMVLGPRPVSPGDDFCRTVPLSAGRRAGDDALQSASFSVNTFPSKNLRSSAIGPIPENGKDSPVFM